MCVQDWQNTRDLRRNNDFHGLHIFAMRASLMISRNFLTSLKLFVEKKYLRSRRAGLAWTKTSKFKKTFKYVYKIGKIHGIWDENHDFHDLHIFAMRASLMISINFLTSLKLFVEKKYLRSRRADLAWTKTQKSKKIQYMYGI